MTTSYPNAVDEIFDQFTQTWKNGAIASIVGYEPEIRYQGVERGAPPIEKYWTRISEQNTGNPQTNLAVEVGNGKRRYTARGLVFIQLFGPLSDFTSMDKLRQISEVTKTAFRGKVTKSGVTFNNVRATALPSEPKYNRINVVAEYEYDEIV